ncbi:MAG: peptide-methionine (S)-S-oxide reductase MsrA [Rhizobiaceae bacterium]|nr:peptide-methionine (S)-S-oxide reductase MsrA [Rhizobiaceae bacterium]
MIRNTAYAILLATAAALPATQPASAQMEVAIFAGGCFWCVEADFDKVSGVVSTTSGYIGGRTDNPTYYDHSSGGHREAVRIEFDNARVSYDMLVTAFFRSIDPTDGGGQFCDRGYSYTTAVYATTDAQKAAAEKAKNAAARELGGTVVTEIASAPTFWAAEDYHQNYYRKNPVRYKYYRNGCRRDARLEQVWGENALKGIKGS